MAQESFSSFTHYGESKDKGSWLGSLAASSAIYVVIGLLVLSIPVTKRVIEKTRPVEVKFVERVPKAPPPTLPQIDLPKIEQPKPVAAPSKVVARPKTEAPAAAAPVVRPDQKIRKLDAPPPPKKLTVPQDMPTKAAEEVDPSLDKGIAVWGEGGKGDVAGLEGGIAGGVAGGMVGGATAVPEDGDPPVPLASNTKPQYPAAALAANQTGTVVLKVIVMADGSVGDVQVMRGEEPFVSAAVEAVKRWRYEPARWKGQAITVYRVVQIPFKMAG